MLRKCSKSKEDRPLEKKAALWYHGLNPARAAFLRTAKRAIVRAPQEREQERIRAAAKSSDNGENPYVQNNQTGRHGKACRI